jgi:hypothetical protein
VKLSHRMIRATVALTAMCMASAGAAAPPEGGSGQEPSRGSRLAGASQALRAAKISVQAGRDVSQSGQGEQPPASEQAAGTTKLTTRGIDYSTVRFERIARAVRVTEPIVVDGRLDEPAWKTAEPATHFTQWEPKPGMPATDDTEVRFLYDDNNLYIGARCFDSQPGNLTINELRKDFDPGQEDGLGIALDTLHDQQTGFLFQTNPAGARRDVQIAADGEQVNPDWDGVWDVKTSLDDKGWIAEIIIPFKTLRFSSAPKQEWGLNIVRRVRRTNEDAHWVPLERRYRMTRVSQAGTLTGIDKISSGRNFKIKPYVVFNASKPEDLPRDFKGNAGLDLKYGLTKAMTLDVTYRTDFSQVEVDQQQVNLTRFSVFFPEKREFFLENAGAFSVGPGRGWGGANVIPFFSRQIGLDEVTNEDGDEETVPVPIVGGARASGKVGTYDIGLLAMRTGREQDAPANTFLVGRVRKNFRRNNTIGAIVTSRQSTVSGDHNRLFGADTFLRFFQKLEIAGYLLGTDSPDLKGRTQARQFGVAWRDNDFNVSTDYDQVQPNFNPEVGFVRRGEMTHYSTDAGWRPRRNNSRIRNFDFGINTDYYEDPDGNIETRTAWANAGIAFQDSSSVRVTFNNAFERLDEVFTIYDTDEKTVELPVGDYSYNRMQAEYVSDRSRMFSGNVNVSAGQFWSGHNRAVRGGIQFKPNYHFNLEFTLNTNNVTLPQGDFTTNLIGVRLLYAFTTRAFFNTFLQYNSTTDQFSANTRFNIIHRPLSDFFVVYNERRDTVTGALIDRGLAVKFTNMFDF